jgi:two-component sensor histidine kinase
MEVGGITGVSGVFLDSPGLLEALSREQELLATTSGLAFLQEAHHQLANSLQAAAGLLHERMAATRSRSSRKSLRDTVSCLRATAAAHRLLASAPQRTTDLRELVQFLCEKAFPLLLPLGGQVRFVSRIAPLELDVRQAPALAVILNELVSNGVEHGLQGGAGEVRIAFQRRGQWGLLSVTDTGQGIEGCRLQEKQYGCGLNIVRSLAVGMLGGRFSVMGRCAAHARVLFPLRGGDG